MSVSRPQLSRLIATVALSLICLALPSFGASGSIEIKVIDSKDKSPLPGALVTVSDPKKSFADKTAVTDLDGKISFDLPSGSGYVVSATFDGYNPGTFESLTVVTGQHKSITISLLESLKEEKTVTTEGKVVQLEDKSSTKTTSAEAFDELPVLGHDYQSIFSQSAGIQDSDGDGNVNVHGSRERDMNVTIDGVSNVDPVSGQKLADYSPELIEEIKVVDSGADASYGGAVGGFATIVGKQGSNNIEWTGEISLSDNRFYQGAPNEEQAGYTDRRPSIIFSGPIIKDRLWYLTNVAYREVRQPIFVLGGESTESVFQQHQYSAKFSFSPNNRNKLWVEYRGLGFDQKPIFVDTLRPASSGAIYEFSSPAVVGNWTAVISPLLTVESVVGYTDAKLDLTPFDPNAKNTCFGGDYERFRCINRETGQRSGPWVQTNRQSRSRWTYDVNGNQTIQNWLGGPHNLKYGFRIERIGWEREQTTNPYFEFGAAPTTFVNVDPDNFPVRPTNVLTLARSYPRRGVFGSNGSNFAVYWNDEYRPASNLSISVGLRYNREELEAPGFLPFDPLRERKIFEKAVEDCIAAHVNSPEACIAFNSHLLTAYPLDNPDLYPACSEAPNEKQCQLLSISQSVGNKIRYRVPTHISLTNSNLAPRLAVSWDPKKDGKTQLAATFGRYYGDTFLEPLLREQGPDINTTRFLVDNFGGISRDRDLNTAFQATTVDRNLRSQHDDEWTATFAREIATETRLKLRYVNRHYRDQFQDTDVNHRPVLYSSLANLSLEQLRLLRRCDRIGQFADCTGTQQLEFFRTGTGQTGYRVVSLPDGVADLQVVSPMFNAIYKIGNYNQSRYQAYIMELERRFYHGWEGSVSYTYSNSFGQAEDYQDSLGNDATNTDDEAGLLKTDQTHVVKASGRVQVPKWGGFSIGAFLTWQSGLPYSIFEERNVIDFPTDLSGNAKLGKTIIFSTPRTLFPTGQRNDRRNSPWWNLDVNFQKQFPIAAAKSKGMTGTFKIEVFNLFHEQEPVILDVRSLPRDPRFPAKIRGLNPIYGYRLGRYIQLGFKLNY